MSGLRSRLPSGSPSRRSPELLPAAAAVVLLIAAGVQFALPSEVELPAVPRVHAAQAQEAAAVTPLLYRTVMAHPIFAPDRTPPPAEVEASGSLNGVEVLGTAIAGSKAAAALLREADGTFTRVRVGEEIEGWKLVSISKEALVFDRNGERRSLSVDISKLKAQASANGNKTGTTQAPISGNDDDEEEDDSDE